MGVIKRPAGGYERSLEERRRARVPKAEAQKSTASTEISIGLPSFADFTPVDLTATAITAYTGLSVEDRRTGILLALVSAVIRARAHGEPDASARAAIEGIQILEQIFDGDESHSLIPKKKKAKDRQKSDEYRLRAFVLSLIISREKLTGSDTEAAATAVIMELNAAMQPHGNLWDIFPADGPRVADYIKQLSKRFVRQIRAEFRPKPDHEAIPEWSVAAHIFAQTVRDLESGSPSEEAYRGNFSLTVLLAQQLREARRPAGDAEAAE